MPVFYIEETKSATRQDKDSKLESLAFYTVNDSTVMKNPDPGVPDPFVPSLEGTSERFSQRSSTVHPMEEESGFHQAPSSPSPGEVISHSVSPSPPVVIPHSNSPSPQGVIPYSPSPTPPGIISISNSPSPPTMIPLSNSPSPVGMIPHSNSPSPTGVNPQFITPSPSGISHQSSLHDATSQPSIEHSVDMQRLTATELNSSDNNSHSHCHIEMTTVQNSALKYQTNTKITLDDTTNSSKNQSKAAATYKNSRFRRLLHPLDKSMIPSYVFSLMYLVVSLASVGPTLAIVVFLLPLAVLFHFIVRICCIGGKTTGHRLNSHEEFWFNECSVSQCLVTLTAGMDLAKLRQFLMERFALLETGSYKKLFPRLTQKVIYTKFHHFWIEDTQFDICNHVLEAKRDDGRSVTCEADVLDYVCLMQGRPLQRDRPLWEIHVLEGIGKAKDSVLLVRLDACMSDGVQILGMICKHLSANPINYGTKKLFGRSALYFNTFRTLFVGIIVFLSRVFSLNDKNLFHGRKASGRWTASCSESMCLAKTLRIKDITRASLNEVLLSVLSGSIREYLISHGMTNPYMLHAALMISMRKHQTYRSLKRSEYLYSERSDSSPYIHRDSSSDMQKSSPSPDRGINPEQTEGSGANTSTRLSIGNHNGGEMDSGGREGTVGDGRRDLSWAMARGSHGRVARPGDARVEPLNGVELSLVKLELPTNTEGAIPQLWDIKQTVNEMKSLTDHVVFHNSHPVLRYILPSFLRQKIWRLFYCRCSILVSSLPGPDDTLTLSVQRDVTSPMTSSPAPLPQIKRVVHFPAPLTGVGVNVSFITYAGQLRIAVMADQNILPDPQRLTAIFTERMKSLSSLLSNRRLPGERTARRLDRRMYTEPDINMIQSRMVEVQRQLQDLETTYDVTNEEGLTGDDSILVNQMESLKVEFHQMLQELRRRMSHQHSEEAEEDFDEEDGELRQRHRLRSLSGVSHRSILSALSAGASRVLQSGSPSPSPSSASSSLNIHGHTSRASDAGLEVPHHHHHHHHHSHHQKHHFSQQRKYHSFHQTSLSPSFRPSTAHAPSRTRMSFDSTNASL